MTYGFHRIESQLPAIAHVMSEADPKIPGRTAYRIMAATAAAVQDAVDTIDATIDPTCGGKLGFSKWTGIIRVTGGYCVLGVVTIDPEQPRC